MAIRGRRLIPDRCICKFSSYWFSKFIFSLGLYISSRDSIFKTCLWFSSHIYVFNSRHCFHIDVCSWRLHPQSWLCFQVARVGFKSCLQFQFTFMFTVHESVFSFSFSIYVIVFNHVSRLYSTGLSHVWSLFFENYSQVYNFLFEFIVFKSCFDFQDTITIF